MQLRDDAATADMYARKAEGQTVAQIAKYWGISRAAVYMRLNRTYGAGIPRNMPIASNDNSPDRVTRMSARNGGCSTTSGLMPVTLRRTAAVNDNVDEADYRAGRAVSDYALRQVAA